MVGKIYKGLKAHYKALLLVILTSGAVQAETLRVVAFGDSLTAGFGLPDSEGFVPQLEAWLKGQGADVEVINAGLSGDTTSGGLGRVAWVLAEGADLVVVELGANDMLRGVSPAEARRNLDGILAEISGRGINIVLAGMLAPPNYGAEYREEFDSIYPDLAEKYDATLYPFFLNGLGGAGGVAELFALMQPDGMHPNAKGVKLIVADFGPTILAALE